MSRPNPQLSPLFILPPERLVECYGLHNEYEVLRAFLIYDHFYPDFPPGMKQEKRFRVRQWVAALALQRLQEKGPALSRAEVMEACRLAVSG